MENPKLPRIFVIAIFSLVFIVMFGSSMFVTIEPGEKGVIFKRFAGGLDKENVKDQGFHIIAPWNDMHVYNVKIQETFEKMEVLSKNGLSIKIDLSFRYNPVPNEIGYLHDNIGKDYLESIASRKSLVYFTNLSENTISFKWSFAMIQKKWKNF